MIYLEDLWNPNIQLILLDLPKKQEVYKQLSRWRSAQYKFHYKVNMLLVGPAV